MMTNAGASNENALRRESPDPRETAGPRAGYG